MLPSIIQHATSRHLCEIAEGYSYEVICNTYNRNVEQCVTLVMVINLFEHKKTNFSTVEFGKWSVNSEIHHMYHFRCFCDENSEKLSEVVQ